MVTGLIEPGLVLAAVRGEMSRGRATRRIAAGGAQRPM